jgi:hypothetical protein
MPDGIEGFDGAALQLMDGDGKERAVDGPQPKQGQRLGVGIGHGTVFPAHVDDQSNPQVMQARVVVLFGCRANEEVGRNPVKIHAGNLTANINFVLKLGNFIGD